jgi:hypothetical protein
MTLALQNKTLSILFFFFLKKKKVFLNSRDNIRLLKLVRPSAANNRTIVLEGLPKGT